MSIDVIAFIEKFREECDHLENVHLMLGTLIEKLRKEADQSYLGTLYRTDYMVTGRGAFPVDMLRYTCSWPKDEEATRDIADSIEQSTHDDQFTIRLTKYHRDPVPQLADDRWLSKFRWKVVRTKDAVSTTED